MRCHSSWAQGSIVSLAFTALAGCAANGTPQAGHVDSLAAGADAQLSSYRIRNWSAPNDHTVFFEGTDGARYKAETLGPCFGLDFANRVGFSNRSGFQQIDRFSSIVLPDGTRCSFQSFTRLVTAEAQALDSFEKLQLGATGADSNKK